MLETLKYLHGHDIVHCDLKPENVVFENERRGEDIFLIDFGLVCFLDVTFDIVCMYHIMYIIGQKCQRRQNLP